MQPNEIIGVIGGSLGILAFLWKFIEVIMSHVVVYISIEPDGISRKNVPTAKIVIENTGKVPKRISYAALLISPESVSLENIASVIKQNPQKMRHQMIAHPMLDIYWCRSNDVFIDNAHEISLIPLTFMYEEQQQIGNERIQYRHMIPDECCKSESVYMVRLVVYTKYAFGFVRWRTTSDLFVT